jgi:hypothetical protein
VKSKEILFPKIPETILGSFTDMEVRRQAKRDAAFVSTGKPDRQSVTF